MLIRFPSSYRVNLLGHIFLKELTMTAFYIYFLKMIYAENDETGNLEIIEIISFFIVQPYWADIRHL